jgi:hypothetical protein
MKHLLRASLVLLSFTFVSGCASNSNSGAPQPLLNKVCLVSGEAVPADGPTVDYQGGKIGFCCKDCIKKWDAMNDEAKKAALAKASK